MFPSRLKQANARQLRGLRGGGRTGVVRRGAALVEFALVSLAFYLLMAGSIELGRLMVLTQSLQSSAKIAAREFALAPFPADYTFEQAMFDAVIPNPTVDPPIYDPRSLVVDMTSFPQGTDPDAVFANLPIVNQSLRFLMIRETVMIEGARRDLIRMPGTLLINDGFAQIPIPSNPLGLVVQVPRIAGVNADGTEVIEWLHVLEEVRGNNSFAAADSGSFSALPSFAGQESALASVRLNLPFQASMLGSFVKRPDGSSGMPIVAVGVSGIINPQDQFGRLPSTDGSNEGAYGGRYGLGSLKMMGTQVRPYRRVISAQSMFRRGVFQ